MSQPNSTTAPYELISQSAAGCEDVVENVCIGLTWTTCRTQHGLGFAMSPSMRSRVLQWPGTLSGQRTSALAEWLHSWDPFEATVGLAACNAAINGAENVLMREAVPLFVEAPGNLAVFEHFRPRLERQRIAVIGRYPGLDKVLGGLDVSVLERQPGENDLPDPAAEFILPQSDWVFISATSLINKTFHRLCQLSNNAVTVLMGPSTPWLAELSAFGVDYLAGVQVVGKAKAEQIAAEGGGTRLFGEGVRYAIADIGGDRVVKTQVEIRETVERRNALKSEMSAWYEKDDPVRFPRFAELEAIDDRLSRLDLLFKRLWDARNR